MARRKGEAGKWEPRPDRKRKVHLTTPDPVRKEGFRIPESTLKQIPTVTGGASRAADFSAALMRGDPAAVDTLRQMHPLDPVRRRFAKSQFDEPKEGDPALADVFIAGSYNLPKAMSLPKREAKLLEPTLQAYRQDVQHAHRFALDDDFT